MILDFFISSHSLQSDSPSSRLFPCLPWLVDRAVSHSKNTEPRPKSYEMLFSHVAIVIFGAGFAQLASAHTAFTNFFVNGVDQGDGTAVRMSNNNQQATYPLSSVTSPDMACGKYICLGSLTSSLCPSLSRSVQPTRRSSQWDPHSSYGR